MQQQKLEKRGNPRNHSGSRTPVVLRRETAVAIMDAGEYCTELRGYSLYEMIYGRRRNGGTTRLALSN